jgi:cobalt/nickel transport system permease protein
MHMADALISPMVGGAMWIATSGVTAYSIKKVQNELEDSKVPLMGVMGAFVFASQMINFSIPGTGSSGHIGGGMLLSALLGPYAGFLTMASILIIQALFFADGGLIALGCNIFNLGFYTCFLAYPLIYKNLTKNGFSTKKILKASLISSIIGLQLGAFSVVVQTLFSGKTELPFTTFLLLMQPIHLGIGIVEGLVTATVLSFLWKARPELFGQCYEEKRNLPLKKVIVCLSISVILIGGVLSWFASSNPDGLEWSMIKASGKEKLEVSDSIHEKAATIQEGISILPDYGFKNVKDQENENSEQWPTINAGTSVSGIVGGVMTLVLAIGVSKVIATHKNRKTMNNKENFS